ncbi:MAG TPA: response regulator [bacterium]|nr:response regulator [bacterium]HOL93187.1 response regulator [bacterium]HPP00198.1 response regulator [bacterium]HXK93385.1 response regulator [bacterium]
MKKIAVVEDNPDNRLLVQAILEDLYEVVEYETGPEALEGMENDPPDLVLLDISLPGMDGAEVLRRLRDSPRLKTLPVVALTAHAMAGDREKYLKAGFDDYVTKPILDEGILLEVIASGLKHSAQAEAGESN